MYASHLNIFKTIKLNVCMCQYKTFAKNKATSKNQARLFFETLCDAQFNDVFHELLKASANLAWKYSSASSSRKCNTYKLSMINNKYSI